MSYAAELRSAHVRRQLNRGDDIEVQERTRVALTRQFARTAFGRELGLAGTERDEFVARVCPRTYEEFAPWIELMKRGEPNVLWPGRCAYYAVSSGTTQGRTKYLPITRDMLAHFRQTGLDSLCLYAARTGRSTVFGGRHLFLGGATSLQPLTDSAPFHAWAGDLSGITAMNLPRWAEELLYEPGREIAQISDWPTKLQAIAERTAPRDIRLLAGIPSWILIFAETLRRQTGKQLLVEVWPHLECLVHGGVPIGPFRDELRDALGGGVHFHEVYPASEAFIAAQDADAEAGLRLLTHAGVYYEFLPLHEFEESRLAELSEAAVPLGEVRTGVDYALLLTTPGGLCRYVIGDVVQFTSLQPPRLVYRGRTRLQLSAFGEHVIEKELTDALTAVCARRGVVIVNFHVAPLFVDAAQGRHRGRHEWWIEVRTPGAAALEPNVAAELDRELQRLNDDYEAKRLGGGLDGPKVRLLPEGTFEAWLRRRAKWGGQNKVPRCRSDRTIADDLAREVSDRAGAQAHDREESLAER
jgi:hypothetical protein